MSIHPFLRKKTTKRIDKVNDNRKTFCLTPLPPHLCFNVGCNDVPCVRFNIEWGRGKRRKSVTCIAKGAKTFVPDCLSETQNIASNFSLHAITLKL